MSYLKPPAVQHGERSKQLLVREAFKPATGSYIVANNARPLKRHAGDDQSGRHKRRVASTSLTNGITSAPSGSLHRNHGTSAFPTLECGTQRHIADESTASMVPIDGHWPTTVFVPVNSNRKSTPGRGPRTAANVALSALAKTRNSNRSNTQLAFTCKCCAKKPKRFQTEAELNAHVAAMKPHICSVCASCFKHKNECERHMESVHKKRFSWSCSAVTVENAFDKSPNRPDCYDACGYCGVKFFRPGKDASGQSCTTSEKERLRHLQESHNYQKCSFKKFFRADHFRQHLEHSHGGTSGKWTKTLENTCVGQQSEE